MLDSKLKDKEDHNATGEGGTQSKERGRGSRGSKINAGPHEVDPRGEAVHRSVLSLALQCASTAPGNADEKSVGT